MSTYQPLQEEYKRVVAQISNSIDRFLSKDYFCDIDRERLIHDIESNVFIENSPSIVSIVEYTTQRYLYVSDNISSEFPITQDELITDGPAKLMMYFDEGHRKVFLDTIYPLLFEYYSKYASSNEAKDLHVSYCALLKNLSGEFQWYYHQLSVLACDEKGFPRYALRYISNIDKQKKDDIINFAIHKKVKGNKPELVLSKNVYPHDIKSIFSVREKEILQLISEGKTTKEIANRLNVSTHTVSTHRKNIARKSADR